MEEMDDDLSRKRTLTEKGREYTMNLKKGEREAKLNRLKKESDNLEQLLQCTLDPLVIKQSHAKWLQYYEEFIEANECYQQFLSPDEKKSDDDALKLSYEQLCDLKKRVEQWFSVKMQQAENKTSKTSPGSTSSAVSRHSSVYSQLSIEKLKESQRKIELLTRAAALKERQKIEEEKLKLKIKEEELELSTEIKISDAKTKVMDELEKSIRMDENIFEESNLPLNLDAPEFKPDMERVSPPPTLPKSANPQMNSYMKPECTYSTTNIYSSNENDGLHRVTRELNKPKSEIIKFEGNPMDYNRFIRQFQTRVLNNTDSYDERMNFLLQFTTGEAHKIASGYSHLSAEVGFTATMKEFKDRYGDPDVVANEYVKKALEWSVIKADNPKALDQYSIFLKECLYAVENVEAARVLEYSENIKRIIMKLPYYLHERWRTIVYELKEKNRVVKFNNLVSFVQREAKKANDPLYGKTVMSVESHSTRAPTLNQRKPYRSFATNTSNDEHRELLPETSLSEHVVQCVYCSAEHSLNSCQDITKQPLKERYQFLRSKGLCFGCLKPGHQKSNCNRKMECHICKRPHPSILHVEPTDNEKFYTKTAATSTGAGIRQVLPIVPVKIKSKSSSKVVETYAFLDTGSTSTFCFESLLSKLNVLGKGHKVTIQTITERQTRDCLAVTGLEILSLDENEVIDLPKIYSQTKLPVTIADRITKSELEKWPHLKNVELPTIDQSNCDVELLIGVDVPRALEPWDVIPSVDNSPFAVKTLFGWAVNGPIDYSDVDAECLNAFSVTCNFIQTSLDQQVRNNFNLDFSERVIDDVPEHSCEDKRFLEIVAGSARFENGHYVMNLPFKSKDIQMPNNRQVAIHRLSLLGKRFKGDAEFQGQYGDFMNKMMENGYARKVPSRDLTQNDGCVWYLPHHGVFHPKKNKIRVVFDCAARFQGRSLNEELLQGPNLTNTLIGTLIRFREEQVAIMGDIDSMFYQVRVPECDASLLRFLWWEDGDINKHIVEYQMMVHLFGARSSPSCANYALKRTVQDRSDDIDEEIADTVMKNFYVDDCLKSVDTVDHAKSVVKGLQKALSQGGFHISKWLSNSREVMQAVPASDRAKEIQDLDLDQDVLPIDRALGVQWNVESDMFCFKVHLKERPLTRRGMLSMISSVYDPLGFLAPFMLQAKNLLKDLCRLGLGWDDPVPEKVVERWYLWLNDVEKLSDFSVTRCLKPSLFGKITSAVLHHFSDASESGYGIVTYLRLVDSDERVHCSFVIGKSRVAPLKQVTIPRLELTAATVAVRTDRMVKSEIDIPLNDSVFWTDSMSVLRYIMNTTSRFHTFVANRLSVIHEGSNPDQWRYVSTKLNPADIASRGIPATDLSRHWIEAPEFLWKSILPETTIPVSDSLLDDDPEVKKINFVKSVTNNVTFESIEEDPIHKLILHYSSWLRLKRAVAWILKVRAKLLQRVKCKSSSQSHFSGDIDRGCPDITVHDLNLAEIIVISYTQKNAFPEEIATLASGKYKLKRDSSIRNLDPVLDDGLLRVGGRLNESCMPIESKNPIILPKNCHVSSLIMRQIHQDLNHVGRNQMLSKLRERFWLINAPSAIRKIISKCVVCRRQRGSVGEQKMSDLPEDRVTPNEPPFTRVGVDYFGPFEVKQGRSYVKRYGVIFTCLASRAVHLEVAASLDTDSYINALRRFIARRGQVTKMRSDNGSNFIGANKELKKAITDWNVCQIHDAMLQKNIDWQFNPPAGSHHGGVWERMIKTVRQTLNSVVKEQTLNDESLHTLFCEVESIINDRPITRNSDSHNDLETLTPNHLLLMKRKPSLPPGIFAKTDNYIRRRWRQVQYMTDLFWHRWTREYLPLLQERQKWCDVKRNLCVGDVVLVVDSNAPRNSWLMGKVTETIPDRLGHVRQVKLKTVFNTSLVRPVDKLCLLLEAET